MARRQMTEEHKAALAKGRRQGRAVRRYLETLETGGSGARTLDRGDLEERVSSLQSQIDDESNPTRRVELIQQRLDLESQLSKLGDGEDLEAIERDFVEAAKEYSERKGITYTAWREMGVPASVLRDAGVPRTRRPA